MLRESLYLPPPQSNIVESGNQLAKIFYYYYKLFPKKCCCHPVKHSKYILEFSSFHSKKCLTF